jgi:acyl-CoA synthetase (NDP forming)
MDLERLFFARSVAVVGASPKPGDTGKAPFYQILQAAGYAGKVFPVNPAHREINGARVYASLAEVPEAVDLVIAAVPARLALETVKIAAARKIPFVHFFTSGFSEVGNRELEAELVAAARAGGTRIVGPNCLGVHCAENRMTFDPSVLTGRPGNIAFLGQSGGITNNFMRRAWSRKLDLNKAVSYGNQIDLRVEDFIEYFGRDDGIRVIAIYLEDVKDPLAFFATLKKVAPKKPVIVLKGGSTPGGARAAASHTGAMAGDQQLFSALLRQHRAIEAEDDEQLVNFTMMAAAERRPAGTRLGFLGAGGGTSVLFTDLAGKAGLSLPPLTDSTRAAIAAKIPAVNTSTMNPVDLGAFGFDSRIMSHTLRAMGPDPNLDVIVPYFGLDFLSWFPDQVLQSGFTAIAQAAAELTLPVVPIVYKSYENKERLEQIRMIALDAFRAAGLPLFFGLQDAVQALAGIERWRSRTA